MWRRTEKFPFIKFKASSEQARPGGPLLKSELQPGLIAQQLASQSAFGEGQNQKSDTATSTQPNNTGLDCENNDYEEYNDAEFGLKIVKSQPKSKQDAIDIVAIHGLGGNWKRTWTEPGSKINWLEELLGDDIPGARILSYGYNSKEYFSKSNADIRDFALDFLVDYKSHRTSEAEKSRPTIFLCHSLGGIVFKQILIRANEEPEYSSILDHVYGVVFFGTPHRGATLAAWKSMSANIVRAASFNTSTNVISKDLKLRSDFLVNVAESWIHRGAKLEIVSCYEMQVVHGFIVVEKDSALLNWANEDKVPMNANHRTICTFRSRSEPEYRKVIFRLKEMATRGVQKSHMNRRTLSEEERVLLSTLETSDYGSHLTEIVKAVHGTCRWIFSTDKYRCWNESSTGRLLWISADAGCGKSVLAKYMIQYHKNYIPGWNVCFFIFRSGNPEQEDSVHALSALLHQIFTYQPELMENSISKRRHFIRSTTEKTFVALWEVFEDCIRDERISKTVCIIDALDECEEMTRSLFVEQLSRLFANNQGQNFRFKLIATSRPDNVVKFAFGMIPNIRIRGEDTVGNLNKDIQLFVQASVEDIVARSHFSPDLLADLQEKLIKGSDFTFLWTSLVIQLLKQGSVHGMSRMDLAGILRTNDIDDIYEQLLSSRRHPLKARKILYIVIAAGRPLTLDELSVASEIHQDYKRRLYTFEAGTNRSDRREALFRIMDEASHGQTYGRVDNLDKLADQLHHPFSNHLRLICGHFLRIRGRKVYLVHQTARDFLLRTSSKEDFSVGYYLRDFNWNISCPTAKELQYMRQHGIPGDFEGTKAEAESQPPHVFKNSILPEVANRYLFQICVDYLALIGHMVFHDEYNKLNDSNLEVLAGEWVSKIQKHPSGAFLEYASRYWVDHYRTIRGDVDKVFDFMCDPDTLLFQIWIQHHPHLEKLRNRRQQHELDINEVSREHGRMETSRLVSPILNRADVLYYFDLEAMDEEQWYDDTVDGSRYWEQGDDEVNADDLKEMSDYLDAVPRSSVPDRVRAYRRQALQDEERHSYLHKSNPGTMGNSFPINGKFLMLSSVDFPPVIPRSQSSKQEKLR
ncbi:alpha/beta-Hydrolase [Glarea lozoyensis ATCC 20868]|uniref:Alpha/beta-Hydrolase n=1 Tax=Glarea lozoyensis (strain ATCC 20868 / MF5171) TaxID=1116229 RepID=S3CI63_GLAL2|nr:alpha/beta-Hydrolase [Glarea lozoyensis ATCC 20868]EPE26177.1 alpha/beta-Hydrolase [Glarea lozoyensis ATCC 20868]